MFTALVFLLTGLKRSVSRSNLFFTYKKTEQSRIFVAISTRTMLFPRRLAGMTRRVLARKLGLLGLFSSLKIFLASLTLFQDSRLVK